MAWLEAAILSLFLLAAVISDLRRRRIPNLLTFPMMLVGVSFGAARGGIPGGAWAVLGIAAGGLLLLPPFLLGGMGAGDIKLLAGVGAFAGPVDVFKAFLLIAILGAVIAVFQLLIAGRAKRVRQIFEGWFQTLALRRNHAVLHEERGNDGASGQKLPYAVPIAIGSLAVWFAR